MYVCVYVSMYVLLCKYVCMCVCIYVCPLMYVCMYVLMYFCMHVCMYVRAYVCMYVSRYVRMYVHVYICMWTHALMYYLCRIIKGYLRTLYQLKLLFSVESYDSTSTICVSEHRHSVTVPYFQLLPTIRHKDRSLQPAAPELPCGPTLSAGRTILYMIISAAKAGF